MILELIIPDPVDLPTEVVLDGRFDSLFQPYDTLAKFFTWMVNDTSDAFVDWARAKKNGFSRPVIYGAFGIGILFSVGIFYFVAVNG